MGNLIGVAPLTVVRSEDGAQHHVYPGQVVKSEAFAQSSVDSLVEQGFLAKVEDEEQETPEPVVEPEDVKKAPTKRGA